MRGPGHGEGSLCLRRGRDPHRRGILRLRREIPHAKKIFHALDGYGLSRVDFFLDKDGVVFNEINTLPGFTGISMYPMLMEKAGIPKKELVQKLIDTAFVRKAH